MLLSRPAFRTLAALFAVVLLGAALATPASAEYTYTCEDEDPMVQVDTMWRYKECDIDFDGISGFDRTLKFYENRGSESDPPHETDGDRHCYQATSFRSSDSEPDADDFEYIRFSLLLPEDYTSGSFPLLVVLRGGFMGWSDVENNTKNSWRLNVEDEDPANWYWEKGLFLGDYGLADGSKDENEVLLDYLTDDDGNVVDELRKTFPSWAIMVPSGCSYDMWNGRDALDPDFKNAAQTRYSYDALVEALEFANDEHGIDYLYVVGGSGGGGGGFILATDLPVDLPTGVEFRGVVNEAAPLEADAMTTLADNYADRDVDSDDDCEDTPETTVPCDHPAEPFVTAFDDGGLTGRNASDDIDPGTGTGTEIPILHMYNKRDRVHCYDYCYSEDNLHGEIRRAIEARTDGGFDEDFDASASVEMCVGSCKGDNGVVIDCTDHTVLGWRTNDPVDEAVTCAVEWVEEVNDYFEGVISTTSLPTACDDIEEDIGGGASAPDCDDPEDELF